jgi:spore coat protein A
MFVRSLTLGTLLLSASPAAFAFEPWVDALPIPPRIVVPQGQTELTIRMTQFRAKVHRDYPETAQWGYNGTSPGPTIEVESGQKVNVHWVNELPPTHFLDKPKDAMGDTGLPDVRTVVHLHGAVVTQDVTTDRLHNNDGWPDLWLKNGEQQIAEYPNHQNARTLWYHDHAMGTTGRNVAAGLLGVYEIHDDLERSLDLPSGKYDIPLVLQPKKLDAEGNIAYVDTLAREHYGNSFFVNGKLYPYLEVEPRKYRFRILNASNARTVALQLVDPVNLETPGPAFHQIGSDSGFLDTTVVLNDPANPSSGRLTLMPAERADVIIDFSKFAGQNFVLHNSQIPDDIDGVVPLYQIMLFKVGTRISQPDSTRIPTKIRNIQRMDPAQASNIRRITFEEMDMDGFPMLTHNGKMWHDPTTDFPVLGTTEIWELVNTLPDQHPFHIHSVDFQILDRRDYDVNEFLKSGKINYTRAAEAPDANEMGWKDTVRVPTGQVTRIIMKFGPHTGHYVYHCHILEHEDMDMMRPFDVVLPGAR